MCIFMSVFTIIVNQKKIKTIMKNVSNCTIILGIILTLEQNDAESGAIYSVL